MDLLIVVSESHKTLYEEFFLPSLPANVQVMKLQLQDSGKGEYLSPGWQRIVTEKLRFALSYAENHAGEIFILSDVDIQFFPDFQVEKLRSELEDSGADILFQRENNREGIPEVNTGFYVARSTPYLIRLLRLAIQHCANTPVSNDQTAINSALKPEDFESRWGILSPRYYARSHGFLFNTRILIHHANCASTIHEKGIQLKTIRSFIEGGFRERLYFIVSEIIRDDNMLQIGGMIKRKLSRIWCQFA